MGTLRKDSGGAFWAEQDSSANIDYSIDWSDWLASGDTIASSSWTVDDGSPVALTNATVSGGSITTVWIACAEPGRFYSIKNFVSSTDGYSDARYLRIYISSDTNPVAGTAIFPDFATALADMRRDRIMLAANTILPDVHLSDDYLINKMRAAEADAERRLRVFLSPVTVFAYEPTDQEIADLNGARWEEESAYDYEPSLWSTEDWGYLLLCKSPVIKVESVVLAYPAPTQGFFAVPIDWVRVDKKYGHVRFVPTGSALSIGPLSSFVLSALGGGRNIPAMLRIRYKAGISNVREKYPDLIDVVKKMSVLRIVEDAYLPQSGSISGDGLSQSISVQMDSYHKTIDGAIDTLVQSLHGVRMMVL